jgi:hypothetical protein
MRKPRVLLVAIAALVLLAIAVPALAAPPSTPPGQANKAEKSKTPEVDVNVTGRIEKATDAEGETTYTVTVDGKTWQLDAGPSWFHGDTHPLDAFVGKEVAIAGTAHEGGDEVDVMSVDGQALRAAGKPAWAGGWKAVGERHPGWSAEKAQRMQEKFGDCFPPGQCKEKPAKSPGADEAE